MLFYADSLTPHHRARPVLLGMPAQSIVHISGRATSRDRQNLDRDGMAQNMKAVVGFQDVLQSG
jgi:hypothetical protein